MFGNHRIHGHPDSRVTRTRRAVINTFVRLVHDRPYDSISVNEVLAEADVGRATFYAHYRNKDDLLVKSVSVVLEVLADRYLDLLRGSGDLAPLVALLEHFRENRRLLSRMTTGGAAPAFARGLDRLAEMIQERLAVHCRETGTSPATEPRLVARAMADGLFGMVRAWIEGGARRAGLFVKRGRLRSRYGRRPDHDDGKGEGEPR